MIATPDVGLLWLRKVVLGYYQYHAGCLGNTPSVAAICNFRPWCRPMAEVVLVPPVVQRAKMCWGNVLVIKPQS